MMRKRAGLTQVMIGWGYDRFNRKSDELERVTPKITHMLITPPPANEGLKLQHHPPNSFPALTE